MSKQQAQEECNINTTRIRLDIPLQECLDIQCRKCRSVFSSLSEVEYYLEMKKKINVGKIMFVLRNKYYSNLKVNIDEKLMIKQTPFQYMYLIPIRCAHCNEQVGYYFKTVNIFGNRWLYHRHALNTEKIIILDDERNLVNKVIYAVKNMAEQYESSLKHLSEQTKYMNALKKQQEDIERFLLKNHDIAKEQDRLLKIKKFFNQMKHIDNKMQMLHKKMNQYNNLGQYYQKLMFEAVEKKKNDKTKQRKLENENLQNPLNKTL